MQPLSLGGHGQNCGSNQHLVKSGCIHLVGDCFLALDFTGAEIFIYSLFGFGLCADRYAIVSSVHILLLYLKNNINMKFNYNTT